MRSDEERRRCFEGWSASPTSPTNPSRPDAILQNKLAPIVKFATLDERPTTIMRVRVFARESVCM